MPVLRHTLSSEAPYLISAEVFRNRVGATSIAKQLDHTRDGRAIVQYSMLKAEELIDNFAGTIPLLVVPLETRMMSYFQNPCIHKSPT